jgi:hypothetical protein
MNKIIAPALPSARFCKLLTTLSWWTISLAMWVTTPTFAQGNFCGNYHEPRVAVGVCGNRLLPSDKVRNLRGLHLECGSGVDHYIRTFVPFDYKKWKRLENSGGQKAMQELRLQEAKIAWSGSVPYQTSENWQWTECTYGQDPVCGYDRVCHTEQQCTTNAEGKQECEDVEVCVDVMRSCYHDEERSESRFCSTEIMHFEADFAKPAEYDPSWGPGAKGYYDVIPNKYDLLPGEVEDVQFFANNRSSTSVVPALEVGDAWNEYRPKIRIQETGSASASCRYNQPLHAKVSIQTVGRIYGKTTPNAFRIPVNKKGEEQNPLEWLEVVNEAKNASSVAVRYKPDRINLMDVSHTMISSMARQSRKFEVLREEAKAQAGKSGNNTPEEYTKNKNEAEKEGSGFWKSTNVRIRLKEITGALSRNIRPTHNLYTTGSESTIDGFYTLELAGQETRTDLYRASGPLSDSWWDWKEVELKKNKRYKLLVSMYQEGVPFYKQVKDTESDAGYSKELEINFKTENLDKRGLMQRFLNWQAGW